MKLSLSSQVAPHIFIRSSSKGSTFLEYMMAAVTVGRRTARRN